MSILWIGSKEASLTNVGEGCYSPPPSLKKKNKEKLRKGKKSKIKNWENKLLHLVVEG